MSKDPIVEEVHRIRRKLSAEFGHNIDAVCADARKREERSGRKIVDLSRRKVRRSMKQTRSPR